MKKWLAVTIVALLLTASGALTAQDLSGKGEQAQELPERGEPVTSMSFPKIWRPYLGAMLNWDRAGSSDHIGLEFHGSIYRDLLSPSVGALGLVTEGYVNLVDGEGDGGLRLMAACSPPQRPRSGVMWTTAILFIGRRCSRGCNGLSEWESAARSAITCCIFSE